VDGSDIQPHERGFGEGPAGAAESSEKQKTERPPVRSAMRLPVAHAQRASAADDVLQELERDVIANDEIVDRPTLTNISTVEIDVAIVLQANEPVPLADEQLDDLSVGYDAVALDRAVGRTSHVGSNLSCGAVQVRGHRPTSAARIAAVFQSRRRIHRRRCAPPSDAPR
jgi:hypothetical protein